MTTMPEATIPDEYAARLVDPAVYATDALHDTYTWLRANNPLGIARVDGYDPFWVVTKYQDVLEISKNNKLFPYGDRPSTLMNRASAKRSIQTSDEPLVLSLIQMDEPQHMKYRLLSQSWFMPANLKKREDEIRAIARKSVSRMSALGGKGDFVASVSLNYPLEIIMNILGVPENDFPFMLRLTQEIFGPLDPDVQRAMADMSPDLIAELQQKTVNELIGYFDKLTEARLRDPKDDLATLLVNARVDDEPITAAGLNGYYIIVATAGHDTTSSSTSAMMWALATQPGLLERVKADSSLFPALIEESIRWATPVKNFMRSAAEDVEISGRTIKKNDWLMLCYASANRDEDIIPDPFEFNIDRSPNKHLAFGFGAHLCLGQHLARMEMRILLEELLPSLKSVKLAGEPRMIESYFVNGLKNLPIEFEMEA